MRVSGIVTLRREGEEETYEDFVGSLEELEVFMKDCQRRGCPIPEFDTDRGVPLRARLVAIKLEWFIPDWVRSSLGGPYEALPIS